MGQRLQNGQGTMLKYANPESPSHRLAFKIILYRFYENACALVNHYSPDIRARNTNNIMRSTARQQSGNHIREARVKSRDSRLLGLLPCLQ